VQDEHGGDPVEEVFDEFGEYDGNESGFKPKWSKVHEESKESKSEVKLWRHQEHDSHFGDQRMTAGSGEKHSFVKATLGSL